MTAPDNTLPGNDHTHGDDTAHEQGFPGLPVEPLIDTGKLVSDLLAYADGAQDSELGEALSHAAQALTVLHTIRIWCFGCGEGYPLSAERWNADKECGKCGKDRYTLRPTVGGA